jgi:hypothetical protein
MERVMTTNPEALGQKVDFTKILPRRESLDDVPFEGFADKQAAWVRRQIEVVGLPTRNISRVRYLENGKGQENVLASVHLADGTLTLYKSLEKLPEAQEGTIVHELAHENSPHQKKNIELYGSEEAMEAARIHAEDIAHQTHVTQVYLNGYHKKLHRQLLSGEIDKTRFSEETHAIMTELRFTNSTHLEQVQDAQKAKLMRLRENKLTNLDYTAILSTNSETEPVGVDKTLLSLMPDFNTVAELNQHIASVNRSFAKENSPLVNVQHRNFLKQQTTNLGRTFSLS